MTISLGDIKSGGQVSFFFNTTTAAGLAITLAGTPAVSVYKQGSTTESTAGVTLTVDYDTRTGMHSVVVDTSADGAFYSAASDFSVVLTAGTVDGNSVVGTVLAHFSVQNRNDLADLVKIGGTANADATLALKHLNVISTDTNPAVKVSSTQSSGIAVTTTANNGEGALQLNVGGSDYAIDYRKNATSKELVQAVWDLVSSNFSTGTRVPIAGSMTLGQFLYHGLTNSIFAATNVNPAHFSLGGLPAQAVPTVSLVSGDLAGDTLDIYYLDSRCGAATKLGTWAVAGGFVVDAGWGAAVDALSDHHVLYLSTTVAGNRAAPCVLTIAFAALYGGESVTATIPAGNEGYCIFPCVDGSSHVYAGGTVASTFVPVASQTSVDSILLRTVTGFVLKTNVVSANNFDAEVYDTKGGTLIGTHQFRPGTGTDVERTWVPAP